MLCDRVHAPCIIPRAYAHFACTRARRYAMCAGVCAQACRFQGDQKMSDRYALKTVHFGTTSQKNLSAYKPVREPCFRAHASAWRCIFFIFFNEVRLGCCARYAHPCFQMLRWRVGPSLSLCTGAFCTGAFRMPCLFGGRIPPPGWQSLQSSKKWTTVCYEKDIIEKYK